MNGWGSLPGNINPDGNKRFQKELANCSES